MIRTVWERWRRTGLAFALVALAGLLVLPMTGGSPALAATCQEVAVNGGFESGDGWQTSSNGAYALFSDYLARSGEQAAHLAGVDNAADSAVTSLALPADSTIALSFWWQVQSQENGGGYDALSIVIADSQGNPFFVVAGLSDLNAADVWQETSVDLSAFAGQTVQLRMEASTDGSLVTDFFVDDLTVTACASATQQIFLPMTSSNR